MCRRFVVVAFFCCRLLYCSASLPHSHISNLHDSTRTVPSPSIFMGPFSIEGRKREEMLTRERCCQQCCGIIILRAQREKRREDLRRIFFSNDLGGFLFSFVCLSCQECASQSQIQSCFNLQPLPACQSSGTTIFTL